MSIKAVILAAGEGNRMRPLTQNRPKVMLPVAGKPMLEHLVLQLQKAGIQDIILVTGYREEKVRTFFGDGEKWGMRIACVHQEEQLGTADAVRMVENHVDDNFLVMNGDIILDHRDIEALTASGRTAMCVYEVENPEGLGVIETQGNGIIRIHEKVENPPSNLANTGLYYFTPEIFEAIGRTQLSPRGEYEITRSLQLLIDSGRNVGFQKIGKWLDTSYPWDLLTANEHLLSGLETVVEGEVEENAVIHGEIRVGKGSVIRSGSYIEGPVVIGEDCAIGPNCYIRPATSIGNGCHVGASVEIKNSIIMDGSKVPHLTYVGDSVIGEGCNLGAGTKIANLKLEKNEVIVDGRGTGRRKLGAVIGDDVQIGINVSINVGTVIGSGARIGPGALVSGILAPGAKVFQRNQLITRGNRS